MLHMAEVSPVLTCWPPHIYPHIAHHSLESRARMGPGCLGRGMLAAEGQAVRSKDGSRMWHLRRGWGRGQAAIESAKSWCCSLRQED